LPVPFTGDDRPAGAIVAQRDARSNGGDGAAVIAGAMAQEGGGYAFRPAGNRGWSGDRGPSAEWRYPVQGWAIPQGPGGQTGVGAWGLMLTEVGRTGENITGLEGNKERGASRGV